MKTPLLGIGILLGLLLLPAFADEEKPQAIYELDFQQKDGWQITPILKAIEGGSPLSFDYPRSTVMGKVDYDDDSRPYVRWAVGGDRSGNQFNLYFEEKNQTTRYVLKGELGSNEPQANLVLQMDTASPSSQGDTSHVVWRDERNAPDGTVYWKPFELSCTVPVGVKQSWLHIGVESTQLSDRKPTFYYALRQVRLVEYGTPLPPEKEAAKVLSPIEAVGLPLLSFHTLRSQAGLSWFGLAVGAGLAGGLCGGGMIILVSRWRDKRRQARHAEELRRIASLDAAES